GGGLGWGRGGGRGGPAGLLGCAGLPVALALGRRAGTQVYVLWRAAERGARRSERRAQLLQQAAVELNQSVSEDDLFRNAPRLLSDILPFTHAEVFVPEGEGLRVHTTWRWQVEPDFSIPFETVTG